MPTQRDAEMPNQRVAEQNYSPVGASVRNVTDPYLLSASDDASQGCRTFDA